MSSRETVYSAPSSGATMQAVAFSHQRIWVAQMIRPLYAGLSVLSSTQNPANVPQTTHFCLPARQPELFQDWEPQHELGQTLLFPSEKMFLLRKFSAPVINRQRLLQSVGQVSAAPGTRK